MPAPLECRAVPPLLSRLLDGLPAPDDRQRLGLHLAGCPSCRALGAQLAFTRRAMAQLAARRRATSRRRRQDV